ncbi:hypothetical protein JIP62_10435 [Brevundimonas vitis]|uniref:Uncharacterized protein n=1 Tax=Brevundimonas vitisensis TaxID=2800818 RepID=A0ABX7BJM0_9CAUL|nr:hypothetical protein [Brevundimonas vitisensis]QQQ17749.1 hypothetical protein JIP62_10435 [Brevundimonas vitisensis]
MSQLLILRQAVIDAIKAALPTFGVEGHLGRFAPADLSRFLTTAPAIRVAILGLGKGEIVSDEGAAPFWDGEVRLAVYVVTRDAGARLTRDAAAMAAVETIVLLAAGSSWGLDFAFPAGAADGQNLFSDETLSKGVALWGINVPQRVQLWPAEGEPDGPLSAMFVGIDPETGAAHEDAYIGPIDGVTVTVIGDE